MQLPSRNYRLLWSGGPLCSVPPRAERPGLAAVFSVANRELCTLLRVLAPFLRRCNAAEEQARGNVHPRTLPGGSASRGSVRPTHPSHPCTQVSIVLYSQPQGSAPTSYLKPPSFQIVGDSSVLVTSLNGAQPTNLRTTNPLSSPIIPTKADVSYSYKLDYGSRLRGLVVLPKEGSSNLALPSSSV